MEPTNDQRVKALLMALANAEARLGLLHGEAFALADRAQRILTAAMSGDLDPRLYQLAWFIRQTTHTSH